MPKKITQPVAKKPTVKETEFVLVKDDNAQGQPVFVRKGHVVAATPYGNGFVLRLSPNTIVTVVDKESVGNLNAWLDSAV